jgi:hypothetical protein
MQRWFLPWWNEIKAEGRYSAGLQCRWHREITSIGDWQVQQREKKLPTKYTENYNALMISATFRRFLCNLIAR